MAKLDGRYQKLMAELKQSNLVIKTGGTIQPIDRYKLPTGSLSLDIDLMGGFPTTGVAQIKGMPSVGKTFLCLSHIGALERLAKKLDIIIPVLWVAFEEFDVTWARNFFHIPFTEIELAVFSKLHGKKYADQMAATPHYIQFDLHQPDGGGEGLEAAYRLMKENVYWAIVIDSIGSLKPEVVLAEKATLENENQKIGSKAQLIEHFVGKIVSGYNQVSNRRIHQFENRFRWDYEICTGTKDCPWCKDAALRTNKNKKKSGEWQGAHPTEFLNPNCCILAINQMRANIPKKFSKIPPPPDASSNFALAHTKRLDLRLAATEYFSDTVGQNKITYGQTVSYRVDKSKISGVPKDLSGGYNIFTRNYKRYRAGTIDRITEVATAAIANGIIEQNGAWFVVLGKKINGQAAVAELLTNEPEVINELEDKVKELNDISEFDPYPQPLGDCDV